MTKLEELQNKPREKRTPIEQCIVDATTFEEAEHDGDIEIMEQAADDLAVMQNIVKAAREVVKRRDVGPLLAHIDILKSELKALK